MPIPLIRCCNRIIPKLCRLASTSSRNHCFCSSIFPSKTFDSKNGYFVNSYPKRSLHLSSNLFTLKKDKRKIRKVFEKSAKPSVEVWADIKIWQLAKQMKVDVDHIFECLFGTEFGDIYDDNNDELPLVVVHAICRLSGRRARTVKPPGKINDELFESDKSEDKDAFRRPLAPSADQCVRRPPVVTIMGHVDHGKTTLLDALRNSQIVNSEFGGITQHIGAFLVKLPHTGAEITFLDTPGHAAFHAMRQRGANATDIVVLVVAAEDGVMDQTVESIKFARNAQVPIVVAINKCDRPNANVTRAKHGLMEYNLVGEEFGGDTQIVEISALKGTNLIALQEAILTQAEIMDLKGDPKGLVEGIVIESRTKQGLGKIASVLVQRGTLKKGSVLVAGTAWCRVRTLIDERGKQIKSVGLCQAAEVTGWREEHPSAGDIVLEMESESRAKEVISYRKEKQLEVNTDSASRSIEEKRKIQREIYQKTRKEMLEAGFLKRNRRKEYFLEAVEANKYSDGIPQLNLILKADVDGSVDAIGDVLSTYDSPKCKMDLIESSIGPPNEWDVEIAAEFGGIIYCFNISTPPELREMAKSRGVEIKNFNIIYRLVEDLKRELTSRLPLLNEEQIIGEADIIAVFMVSESDTKKRKVPVAGCHVIKGRFDRKASLRIIRNEEVIYEGPCESMKKEKESVNSANVKDEVGIRLPDPTILFRKGDLVECYEMIDKQDSIDWFPPGF